MVKTLRAKIFIYFVLVSLSGVLLVGIYVQWEFKSNFKQYLTETRNNNIDRVLAALKTDYKENGSLTNRNTWPLNHEQAMSDRIFYRIYNEKGKKISDTFSMQSMMGQMQMDFQSSNNWKTSTADIIVNHKKVGKIVAFYPAGLYDREYTFLRRIQMSIVLAILITIGVSFLASWLFSKRLTSGLKTLSDAVVRLKAHRLTEDIPVLSGGSEGTWAGL